MTEHTDAKNDAKNAATADGDSAGHEGAQRPVPPVAPPAPPAFVPGVGYVAPEPYSAEPYSAEPYSAGQYPAGQYSGPVAPRTNTLSIVSLVTGFFFSLAAVITGHIALGQIKRSGEAGKGMAIAGLVLGYVGIGTTVIAVTLAIVFAASLGLFLNAVVGNPVPVPANGGTNQVGAAYLDEGYLQAGSGDTVVDLYIDPMCPYCGHFEVANGAALADLVDDGSISLRVHSLTFLDSMSQGSEYSTRASNALACEAATNPDSMLDYMAALFAHQPAEGTSGLTDDELVALSDGSESIADCVASGRYAEWSQQNTDNAVTGPIVGAEIDSIQGTPTVLVNGMQYTGAIDDPRALTDFILG